MFQYDPTMQTILLFVSLVWLPMFLVNLRLKRQVQKLNDDNRKMIQASLKLSRMAYNKATQCYEMLAFEMDDGTEDEGSFNTDVGDDGDLHNEDQLTH